MTTRRKTVTRADVARLAGLSTAVVSYVLSGSDRPVSQESRARVLAAVEALGYRPNAAAQALSRGRSTMIGFIVPDQRNPFFAEMMSAVDSAAHLHDLTVLTLNAHERRAGDGDELAGLTTQQLEGIVSADVLTPQELSIIERNRIPLVYLNQFSARPGHPTLGTDYLAGSALAVNHLLGLGHRKIAFVGNESPLDPREAGWRRALHAAGVPAGPVFHSDYSLQGGYDAGLRVADARDDVTAVFAASDQVATGLLAALHSRGIDIPGDISVVGFDGTPEAAFTWPALTSVSQPVHEMAYDAVALLVGGEVDPVFRDYPVELVVRASTAPPRG
ncbi:LacI family DNA-binding transcriptional regulator [Microbacterium luticocti]|uniref:LacI family DNA-binding transcriptional regulator n=1 Tax=Microbacterium luticocti TaxID=451764 RepID=UPI0003F9F39E|nr:LacI family DNA-binding transcriptional regulator [Microbacterium luticocti]